MPDTDQKTAVTVCTPLTYELSDWLDDYGRRNSIRRAEIVRRLVQLSFSTGLGPYEMGVALGIAGAMSGLTEKQELKVLDRLDFETTHGRNVAEKIDYQLRVRERVHEQKLEFKRQERAEKEAEKAARAEAKRLADAADPAKAAKVKHQAQTHAKRQALIDRAATDLVYNQMQTKLNAHLRLFNWGLLHDEDVCEGLRYVHGDYVTQMLWTEPDGPDADPVIRATVCNMMGGPLDEHTFDMPWREFCYILARAYEWEKDNGCLNPTTGQPYSENKFARSIEYTRAYFTGGPELKIPELTLKKITRTLR